MRKSILLTLALVALTLLATSCNRLSKEAKEIVGTYYNTEISETEPALELRKDGTCTIRNIKPGVLSISVDGKWNVKNDSLIIKTDTTSVKTVGDTTIMGKIARRYAQKVVSHTEFTLQLERNDITYLYQRRN